MLYHFLDFLQERLARETSRPEFSKLPLRFAEIAKVILDVSANTCSFGDDPNFSRSASDDVQNADKIKSLLKDLREARQAKSRDGLQKLDHSELSVRFIWLVHHRSLISIQLPNLCSMEINEIRPFFIQAMGILTQLVREPSAE
jgi:GINS complex subunit 2